MKNRTVLLWIFTLIVLGVFNALVLQKENLLANSEVIYLELAPVDPRSLIQGDYMRLRYALAATANQRTTTRDGFIVARVDNAGIARFVRIHDPSQPLAPDEFLLRFKKRTFDTNIGPESFFFQEGHAQYYQDAKYGEIRINKAGDVLLVGLRGSNLEPLGPP